MLSVDSLFFAPHNQRDIATAVRRKFQCSDSDHVTLVRIFKAYKAAGGRIAVLTLLMYVSTLDPRPHPSLYSRTEDCAP